MNFRTAYGEKLRVSVAPGSAPGAKQSFKDECDINRIMRKAQKGAVVSWLNTKAPQYGDFSDFDFRIAMDTIAAANESFAALPSQVRKRFANDPGEFLAFMGDASNTDEAIKLGLAVARPDPVAAVAAVVPGGAAGPGPVPDPSDKK